MGVINLFIVVSLCIWIIGFIFISTIYHDDHILMDKLEAKENELADTLSDLDQKTALVDALRKEIAALKGEIQLRFKMEKIKADAPIDSGNIRSYEGFRRKIFEDIKDISYYFNDRLDAMASSAFDKKELKGIQHNFKDRINVLLAEYYNLTTFNGETKRETATGLSNEIQKRFEAQQNPIDCQKARKLICDINKGCGFGCQLHHVAYCFIEAIHQNRTMILKSDGWSYDQHGYSNYFKPMTSCPVENTNVKWNGDRDPHDEQIISLDIIDLRTQSREYLPLSVPVEYKSIIEQFHGSPFVWWIGQMLSYVMRLSDNMKNEIERTMVKLEFETPCIGMHVRRTDKINTEAALHYLDEYMKYADDYFKIMEYINPNQKYKRVIYLATDEESVISETKKYTNYKFVHNDEAIKTANTAKRYSTESLKGLISDIVLLSKCEYLICTFSSQVCRLAYELMQVRYTDASWRFKSLDDIYYYGGQNEHTMRVVYNHESDENTGEIELRVGDTIGIAGNHWNGYSKGRNYRTNKIGLFPSYKVVDLVVPLDK